jgi:hypothetical protein
MGRVCKEVQDWVEQQIEQPIESWENQQEKRCAEQDCDWWCACCNKWFCWLVWILVKIVRWVLVTVGKWVARLVCEVVNIILDVGAFLVELILSIPIIGGIIRTASATPTSRRRTTPSPSAATPADSSATGCWRGRTSSSRRRPASSPMASGA